jgi:putative transposase
MSVTIQTSETITCKNCGSTNIIKFGSYKGVPRYFCHDCKRKFKADDTQFHAKYPLEWESAAVDMYFRGMAVTDIREHLKQEHGYSPSKSVIYGWIDKYTELASKQFKDEHPKVGDTWIADETMLDIDQQKKVWFYDIIDRDTRFLLASRVTLSRTTKDAEMLMRDAEKCAGKKPKEVLTDNNYSYINSIPEAFNGETEHVIGNPFKTKVTGLSTSEIERFHGTLKDRTKVFRAFRDVETLIQFTDGWLVYYNYFKVHEGLNGKTPAQEAKVDYKIKNWSDLARVPVTKESEIKSHKNLKLKLAIEKVNLDRAFKRVQGKRPRGDTHLNANWREDRRLRSITPKPPRITPKRPSITKRVPQHFSKRGGGFTRRGDIS